MPIGTNPLNIDTVGPSNECSECKTLKRYLEAGQEKNITLLVMMEYIKEERDVITTQKEALSRIVTEKEKQVLGLLAELNHIQGKN